MRWDLWVDFHRVDEDGLTLADRRDARRGLRLHEGGYVVVGNEDCEPAVARVVALDPDGFIRLRVLPGPAEDHLGLLDQVPVIEVRGG